MSDISPAPAPAESMTPSRDKAIRGLIERGCKIIGDDKSDKGTMIPRLILSKIIEGMKDTIFLKLGEHGESIVVGSEKCNPSNFSSLEYCGCKVGKNCFFFASDYDSKNELIKNFLNQPDNESCTFYLIKHVQERKHYVLEV